MSDKIKVCHFTSVHPANDTRIFVKECTSLARAGFDVYLVAVNAENISANGITIINVPAVFKGRVNRMLFTAARVYEKALQTDSAVYHFHDPELIPYGLKLIAKGKKVIYDVHEDLPRQILAKHFIPNFLRKLVSRMVEKYEKHAASKFSWIIAATPFIKNIFLNYTGNVTHVCNFPLIGELNAVTPYSQRPFQVCYIGSITRVRGILELISAMDALPYSLHLCGEFSPPSLRDEAIKLNGWSLVVEHGYSSREEINNVLDSCRAGIVTLHPVINYQDAYPVKMFEYMMAGIPVIASDIALWKQIIDDTQSGLCVNPHDSVAIKNAIVYLMENVSEAGKMGEAGKRAVAGKYNWSHEEEKLLNVYHILTAE